MDKDERKIVTVKVAELSGQVTLEEIQIKIDQTKENHKYDWIKFYIDNSGFLNLFSTSVHLYAEHYQTNEQVEKDKRLKLFYELKEEFEPVKSTDAN